MFFLNLKKKQIIDAAHRLFIDKGFHLTSIQDILDEAGIAKGTFYNYFSSKNECLLAIVEYVNEECDRRRKELAFGKSKDDKEVFIAQMTERINMYQRYHFIDLFASIFSNNALDLKTFVIQDHCKELIWTSTRLAEIYHIETKRYSLDQAVMLVGMIHHFIHVWTLGGTNEIDAEPVIRFVLARMEPMIQEQIQSGDLFFPEQWLEALVDEDAEDSDTIICQIITQMQGLARKVGAEEDVEKKIQYIDFVISEIKQENPRFFLIESVLCSLSRTFERSDDQFEAGHTIQSVWSLVERLSKDFENKK